MTLDPRSIIHTCRNCGCDDQHACITADGPCSWTLLDIDEPTGICSACAKEAKFHPLALVALGLPDEEQQAQAILAFANVAPPYREQAIELLAQLQA